MDTSIAERRYGFGRNWSRYLKTLDREAIATATASLARNFRCDTFAGRSFLDIGSGSGLFSLAAHRLGARVHSFDYDDDSVACTRALREQADAADEGWSVEQGSILDEAYVAKLGSFDLVYSWGVLHHTGSMWCAIDHALRLVGPQGKAVIALYNDQGWRSRYWSVVKRHYNRSAWRRAVIVAVHMPPLFLLWVAGGIRRRLRGEAFRTRGMRFLTDMFDWLGGYPFEVASPSEVTVYAEERGFSVSVLNDVGHRMGCNEFLLERLPTTNRQVARSGSS